MVSWVRGAPKRGLPWKVQLEEAVLVCELELHFKANFLAQHCDMATQWPAGLGHSSTTGEGSTFWFQVSAYEGRDGKPCTDHRSA